MSNRIANALVEAINDEYKARAMYQCVINQFGRVRPFINIIEAETRHIQALIPLFHKYGVPVPEDDWLQRVDTPESIVAACRIGVDAEIENAGMYDRLLKQTEGYPDIQQVMTNLQRASTENHLPAFQRCSERASGRQGNLSGKSVTPGRRGGGNGGCCGGRRRRGGHC